MIRNPKFWLPLAFLAAGGACALVLLANPRETSKAPPAPLVPTVRTVTAEESTVRLHIETHGTVSPRTETDLVAEVAGRVEWVSPSLVSGGFFEQGDPLLRIDAHDYEVALERARAQRARAASELEVAARELERQQTLADKEVASASRLDDARNRALVAEAALREARAALAQAERDLERTGIRAPYAGRVREKTADVGQFVARGAPLARVYAVDWAEVRLPIRDEELAFIDLPPSGVLAEEGAGPEVVLRASYAGAPREWRGRVVRTEGEIDPRSRMVHVVARVEDPYGREARTSERPPFPVGLFVDAEIVGRRAEGVIVLPRAALREGDRVLVVDGDDRLRFRSVDVLRRGREDALIRGGLAAGERVCISPLETPVDGMEVRAVDATPGVSLTRDGAEFAPSGDAGASS